MVKNTELVYSGRFYDKVFYIFRVTLILILEVSFLPFTFQRLLPVQSFIECTSTLQIYFYVK